MGHSSELTVEHGPVRGRLAHLPLVPIALAAIILLNVLGSLWWIQRNVLLLGNDASDYLSTTLEYARFLTHISPTTLFEAFTYPEYRTPGIYLAAQPFLWLFGANMDSAQLVNVAALAAVVWICFELGRLAGGDSVGLMSALLVGLLPMVMAMSRLFYTELPLAAMVGLNLLALTKSDGFRRRGWSVVWGVSLGLGLLVKWALPIYVMLPTVWVIWRSGLIGAHLESLRKVQVAWRPLAIAAAISLAGTLLWSLPNRATLERFLLGDGLMAAWFLAGTLWLYTLQLRASRVSNWWAGALTGLVLASLWYFPYADFIARLAAAEQERGDAGATPLNLYNYVRYFTFFYRSHLGALATWIVVPTALFPWLRSLWRREPIHAASKLLWLSLLSTYLILLLLSQSSPRFLVPVLPSIVVLAAVGLWRYARPARIVIGAAWIAVLALQWSLFTFDALQPVYATTEPLWTTRSYAVQPRSNETDLSYWIGPDVLDRMEATESPEIQRLGMLVNSPQLHRGILKYIINVEQRTIEVQTLTEEDSPGWSGVLGSQWVLVKDGDNRDVAAPAQALIDRILSGDPLFDRLYREEARYPFPNGETAYLYHRVEGPGRPRDLPLKLEQTAVVADAVRQAWSPHASVLYADADMAVWVGIHDPPTERATVLDGDERVDPGRLSEFRDTLLVVWEYHAHNLSDWMDRNAYRAGEIGDEAAAVAIFGRPQEPLAQVDVDTTLPDVALKALRTLPTIAPGQVLPIETEVTVPAERNLKVSMRLVSQDGAVVASNDRPLAATDRLGLFVPPTATPGEYDLVAVVYDPATMEVLADVDGASPSFLARIHVTE